MSADEGVLPERWPECEGPACGYRHDPNLPCFTDATDHDSVPGSTDTAGDPNRWTAKVASAGGRTVIWMHNGDEQWATQFMPRPEAESLAAQINRPATDPDLLADLLRRMRAQHHKTGSYAAGSLLAEVDAVLALLDAGEPPTGSGCA